MVGLKMEKNVYMARNVSEFKNKIEEIVSGELPSLVQEAYSIAEERKSENIGEKLKMYIKAVKHYKTKKSKGKNKI